MPRPPPPSARPGACIPEPPQVLVFDRLGEESARLEGILRQQHDVLATKIDQISLLLSSGLTAQSKAPQPEEPSPLAPTPLDNACESQLALLQGMSVTDNDMSGGKAKDYDEPVSDLQVCKEPFQCSRGTPVFANAESTKAQVRLHMRRKKYDVADMYKQSGCFQAIARHPVFEAMTLSVIGINAIWIAIDTDYNDEDLLPNAHPVFRVMDNLFCAYFTVELLVRFASFEHKRSCLRDAWFIFDAALVMMMVLETWVMSVVYHTRSGQSSNSGLGDASILRIARLLRLTRMARIGKLLVAVPELMILIKGIVTASRSVAFTLILLLIQLYVFAIAFTQTLADTAVGKLHFFNVGKSMHTLWVYGALLDEVSSLMAEIEQDSILCVVLLDLLILSCSLTLLNMLVGVLVDVVSGVASKEKEQIALVEVESKLHHIIFDLGIDRDGNGTISKAEFVSIIENREGAQSINDLGVNVIQLIDMADVLFAADKYDEEDGDAADEFVEKELTLPEFVDIVVDLRGSNLAKLKDIMSLRTFFTKEMAKIQHQMERKISAGGGPARQISDQGLVPRRSSRRMSTGSKSTVRYRTS